MHRLGLRSIRSALALALCLVTASCIGAGSSDDDAATADTTATAEPDTTDRGADETTTTVTATTLPAVGDLTDVSWVVNDFDGLVDDRGRTIDARSSTITENPRPSVIRAVDGSIYYVLDGRLWRREIDAGQAEEVDVEAAEIDGVSDDGAGNIIVNPYGEPEVVAEGAVSERSDSLPDSNDLNAITASNGITVRVLPPDADVDDRGYVTEFRAPARLEVERNGVVEWTIDAGGVRAPWLTLVDFDGRFVMMARYPTEPADPGLQHIVYDLDCPNTDAMGSGCTRSFVARWGTAALVGPDREPGDDDLNTALLDICPTMGRTVEPPAEMTDPGSFDEDFTADDLAAFRAAAFQLTTCDPDGLGDPEQPGLLYVSGSEDPAENGWMWTEFARSLRGPFTTGSDNTFVWSRHDGGPAGVLDRNFDPSRFELVPGRRHPDHVAVTATADSMLVAGRTDVDTAATITSVLQPIADERGVTLGNRIDTTGAAHPTDLVDDFVSSIEDGIVGDRIGEIHLTAEGVIRSMRDPGRPSTGERALGFLMADFASGGEGVYAELPLGDDILVALGSEVVARRQVTELFRRSAWAVNSSEFAGRDGPFNVLDLVPSPSEVVVGPHPRCAGPESTPSPPELASLTRIGILPLADSIDSCLQWSAVDLFVDDRGVIRGVALHLEEP